MCAESSKLHISPDLKKSREAKLRVSPDLENSRKPNLRMPYSDLKERISDHVTTLETYVHSAQGQRVSLFDYMRGNSMEHMANAYFVKMPENLNKAHGVRSPMTGITSLPGVIIDTGAYYSSFVDNPNMFKFYLSMNESAEGEGGQEFVRELIRSCTERKITLRIKTLDHNYDSCNIYTTDFRAMKEVLIDLYPKHMHLFQEVPRVFQGEINGINPNHIGYVQEPAHARLYKKQFFGSHSDRMGELGQLLENEIITAESFRRACKYIGIKPEAPWLLEENTLIDT
jgi:hypothetical protein